MTPKDVVISPYVIIVLVIIFSEVCWFRAFASFCSLFS